MSRILHLLLLVGPAAALVAAGKEEEDAEGRKNPIRKVVTMLQSMQKKVSAEGEKAEELYEKFMCYCKTSGSALEEQIAAAGTKTAELESSIKASEEELVQCKDTLKAAQVDRAAAKEAMSEATAMREKEAKAFASEKAEYEANIDAMSKAIAALEKGMGGAFIQSRAAKVIQKLVSSEHMTSLVEYDRQELMAFLSGQQGDNYAPASGEITGILKTMNSEMKSSLKELVESEEAAIKEYESLMTAKTKEVEALTKKVETKMTKVGELGVEIAQMKNDLGNTGEALLEDKKFLKDMEKSCSTKTGEYEESVKMRTQELAAIAETIKILNDDDALELFKKTLPAPGGSLLQVSSNDSRARAKALEILSTMQKLAKSHPQRAQVDFIALMLKGQKIGFEKVIKMIDEMIGTLKKEQVDDDAKKEYCAAQFDATDDKKKSLEQSLEDLVTVIANAKEGIETTKDEIAGLTAGIKKLDKAVMEATEQRKEENQEYKELMASNTAAKELLGFAKNRLNKFYNPKLYKPPPQAEPEAASFVQIAERFISRKGFEAPPPPPPTAVYAKKGEESGSVIAMIDLLVKDIDREMTISETEENDSQNDYEGYLKDSQEKRTEDSKTLTDKESALATMEGQLLRGKEDKKATAQELMAVQKMIASLHAECDWLIQYYDVRKEARTSEIDALGKAKAVLSGADLSLAQTEVKAHHFLKK